jgi:hypothetical protein
MRLDGLDRFTRKPLQSPATIHRTSHPPFTLPRSEHEVNTPRCVLKSSSMRHTEGGWPKDVDPSEQADVTRFRKKVEKDDEYKAAVKALGPLLARCLKQNNTVDIYEEYFVGADYGGGGGNPDESFAAAAGVAAGAAATATTSISSGKLTIGARASPASPPRGGTRAGIGASTTSTAAAASLSTSMASDPPSAKGLAVLRDPCPVKRAATMLNWHPEGHGKLAVAYSLLNFQVCVLGLDSGGRFFQVGCVCG